MVFTEGEIELQDLETTHQEESDSTESVTVPEVQGHVKIFGVNVAVLYIFGNEFCERFSFYGLRAILLFFLINTYDLEKEVATTIYHSFVFFAYLSAIPGAAIADTLLGKYFTILIISFVYCCGTSLLAVSAADFAHHLPVTLLALFIIAAGTGGIKSAVSSFVGDQSDGKTNDSLYFYFYMSINVGALLSSFLTPILYKKYSYSVAFGVPAALLFVSTVIFLVGTPFYTKVKPDSSAYKAFIGVISTSISAFCRNGIPNNQSFFSPAIGKYGNTAYDVIKTLKVTFVFLPLPIFWALYDQSSSRWIYQASLMNRKMGQHELSGEQMAALNPLCLITLIPIFDRIIYPALAFVGVSLKPLSRMIMGMIMIAISFFMAGVLQVFIDQDLDNPISIFWQTPQYVALGMGEVMVSITGLSFAYSEAPESMKAMVMAMWLMTVSIGNFVVVVFSSTDFPKKDSNKYFFFGALMVAFDLLFSIVNRNYKYTEKEEKPQE